MRNMTIERLSILVGIILIIAGAFLGAKGLAEGNTVLLVLGIGFGYSGIAILMGWGDISHADGW